MKTKFSTSQLVILGLMTAILLLMAYTPLGYLNIGPLAVTFNVIPVAVAAITLGPAGGAIVGSAFETDQLSAVHRRRRYQRNGCCTVRNQPGTCIYPAFHPAYAGWTVARLHFPWRAYVTQHIRSLLRHRIFLSLPEYVILHDTARRALRQYGIHAEPDGRKECHRLLLRLCRCQCRMRDDFFNGHYRRGRTCTV